MKKSLLPVSLCLLLASCAVERTVYDQDGNVVDESASSGGEKDLSSVMEARFNSSFKEKVGKDGIPVASSGRVSSFQSQLDSARDGRKQFSTGAFGGLKNLGVRDSVFSGAGKSYGGAKEYGGLKSSSPFSSDLRPDFLNSTHGLSGASYAGADKRTPWKDYRSAGEDKRFVTYENPYSEHKRSGYIWSRESKTPQPKIVDHEGRYQPTIEETRRMLGRDESSR